MRRLHWLQPDRLRPGLIFGVAHHAGIEVKNSGEKRPIRCPFHEDRNASAFLSVRNVFFCSVCTPDRGMSAREFAKRLGIRWPLLGAPPVSTPHRVESATTPERVPTFTPAMAQRVWATAVERAATGRTGTDRDVHDYLERRGLLRARGKGLYGVLGLDSSLPPGLASWPRCGYGLVVPLHDASNGEVVNVQARAVRNAHPKVLSPRGSRLAGTLFASAFGIALLRRAEVRDKRVLLGEGLTDFLALAIAVEIPVFSCPGTSVAVRAIGPWVRGRVPVIALDSDAAGDAAAGMVAQAAYSAGAERVRRLRWPDGCKDACDVVAKRGIDGLGSWLRANLND